MWIFSSRLHKPEGPYSWFVALFFICWINTCGKKTLKDLLKFTTTVDFLPLSVPFHFAFRREPASSSLASCIDGDQGDEEAKYISKVYCEHCLGIIWRMVQAWHRCLHGGICNFFSTVWIWHYSMNAGCFILCTWLSAVKNRNRAPRPLMRKSYWHGLWL